MNIKVMKLSDLNAAAYNPRRGLKPGDVEYEKLNASLKEFGMVEPLVFNEQTGNLVGGHQRLTVLKNNGVEEVEVSIVNLTLEKEKMLNLALNKIQGDWDDQKLSQLLYELGQVPDLDVALTGFGEKEISDLLEKNAENIFEAVEEDVQLQAEVQPSITQKGDLIELGFHRLLCGDSASQEDL